MEETMTKVILIAFSLMVIAILMVAYVRIYGNYQEVQDLVASIHQMDQDRTLEVMYCFLNDTSGKVEIHVFNYGTQDLTYRVVAYYQKSDESKEKAFDYEVSFPSQEMTIIDYTPSEAPPEEFDLILMWPEAGDIELVRCVGS